MGTGGVKRVVEKGQPPMEEKKYALRKAYGEALLELGRSRKDVVVLDADLALSTQTARFRKAFPDRFFDMGIAEADMIDTAVGLASTGKLVFASTFAMFAVGKPWEQIRNSAAYSGIRLNIVATHSGISVGEDGASHQCIEDMALVRIIPGSTVIAPCDDISTYKIIMELAKRESGLVYVRLTRPNLPRIYADDEVFEIGKAKLLREGTQAVIVAVGLMVAPSLKAADILARDGISVGVIDMFTVKPLDTKALYKAAAKTGFIVTVEEHTVIGGLGEAVAAFLSENYPTRLKRIGVQDRFGESGQCNALLSYFRFTPEAIAADIKQAISEKQDA